jgi:hypothetical protein
VQWAAQAGALNEGPDFASFAKNRFFLLFNQSVSKPVIN